MKILNISFYHFVAIPESDIESLRKILKTRCLELGIKGTINLSVEGINAGLCGEEKNIRQIQEDFSNPALFDGLFNGISNYKNSWSDKMTFPRTLVKHRPELVPLPSHPINPGVEEFKRITPQELKQWYDDEKDFVIIDTRKDFEYRFGTFKNAINLHSRFFRDIPERLEKFSQELKEKPVVMFCTGGIRCEKAVPLAGRLGFANAYQLDGGILKYFEDCGGAHWIGECFVFDHRVGVGPDLKPTGAILCKCCGEPLTLDDQKSPQYQENISCPYCETHHDILKQAAI